MRCVKEIFYHLNAILLLLLELLLNLMLFLLINIGFAIHEVHECQEIISMAYFSKNNGFEPFIMY